MRFFRILRKGNVIARVLARSWQALVKKGYVYSKRAKIWFKPPEAVRPPPKRFVPRLLRRVAERVIKRKPRRFFWRFAYGVKLVAMGEEPDGRDDILAHPIAIHTNTPEGGYYGAIIYTWLWAKDTSVEKVLREILLQKIEDFVGYRRHRWRYTIDGELVWPLIDDGWGWMEFPLEDYPEAEELIGKYEWRIEDDSGVAVRSGSGWL